MEYKILQAFGNLALERLVNEYLAQGWTLHGFVFHDDDLTCQVVIKEDGNEKMQRL